jgi:uncharacterized membrane protein
MTITTNLASGAGEGPFAREARFSGRPSLPGQRAAFLLAGAALGWFGISRRGWGGIPWLAAGACLVYRGFAAPIGSLRGRGRLAYTINRVPGEVVAFARAPENWHKFLQGFEMVSDGRRGLSLSWGRRAGLNLTSEAEITDEKPGEYIAWSSLPGNVDHRGVVQFRAAPGNRGTEIAVAFEYQVRAGHVGRALASLVGWEPEQMVGESLRHLRQILETGEIPTTAAQAVGARGIKGTVQRVLYREDANDDAIELSRVGD